MGKTCSKDPVRRAAAFQVGQLGDLADDLVAVLAGVADLPAEAIASVLLDAGKMLSRLEKHKDRLRPPSKGSPSKD